MSETWPDFLLVCKFWNIFDLKSTYLNAGKDAVHPFIVDEPSKIYEKTKVDVDAMFSICSSVSSNQLDLNVFFF